LNSELLIEIGVEELPSSYIKPAAQDFSGRICSRLKEVEIDFGKVEVFYTPRRLAVLIRKIEMYEKKKKRRVFGPPIEEQVSDRGKPSKAAIGFAESYGKNVKDLGISERKSKKVYFIEFEDEPRSTKDILREDLPSIIESIYFPKKMRWEETRFHFARPIRWIVVILGKKTLKLKIAGVTSSRYSLGPRFYSSSKINLTDAVSYEKTMREKSIIVSFKKRKEMIKDGITSLLKKGEILIKNEDLLDEVTNLVEYPVVFRGHLDKEFVKLPKDVIITAMKEHQRYFALEDKKGNVRTFYIGVSNGGSDNLKEIAVNNDSVLKARLTDARFYWTEDLKKPLGDRVQELKGVEWHSGLGSVFDKTKRLILLSLHISRILDRGNKEIIKRGALLSKADLVTNMVKDGKEFTKLEGIIGREYAIETGEQKEVAKVISDHYLPRNSLDKLPSTTEAIIVGVSDRIDTLVGSFLAGEEPTGSEDPLGLRRCANGLLRIILKFKLSFDLENAISKSILLFKSQDSISIKTDIDNIREKLINFLMARLLTILAKRKTRNDISNAVLSVYRKDLYVATSRIEALSKARGSMDFEKLVTGQKRVANILKGIDNLKTEVDENLFDNNAELKLWNQVKDTKKNYYDSMREHRYEEILKILLSFRSYIDDFFDSTMVMSENKEKRDNRIKLLVEVRNLFYYFADFSLIVIEKKA